MRFTLASVAALLICAPLTVLADAKVRIAVMDFTAKSGIDQAQLDVLTDVAANEIRSTMLYDVVSKEDIHAMLSLEEQKQLSGCDEASCLVEIGGALGVDYMVTGNVGRFGEVYAVNLKLVNIRRARVENSVFRKLEGGEMALLDDLPGSLRKLLGLAGGHPADPMAADPAASAQPVVPPTPVTNEATERELVRLGYSDAHLARLRERKLLVYFDLPRIANKLAERGFAPDDVMMFLCQHDLLDRVLEDRIKWVIFYASGLNPRLWNHYKRSRTTLTEYYNDRQESTALEVLQWISLGLGVPLVLGGSLGHAGLMESRDSEGRKQNPSESTTISLIAVGSGLVGAFAIMLTIDLLDRGQVPERFFEKATKAEILERIPEAAAHFESAGSVQLGPWIRDRESGGVVVGIRF